MKTTTSQKYWNSYYRDLAKRNEIGPFISSWGKYVGSNYAWSVETTNQVRDKMYPGQHIEHRDIYRVEDPNELGFLEMQILFAIPIPKRTKIRRAEVFVRQNATFAVIPQEVQIEVCEATNMPLKLTYDFETQKLSVEREKLPNGFDLKRGVLRGPKTTYDLTNEQQAVKGMLALYMASKR